MVLNPLLFCLQPNTLTWLFSSSHKRQNLLPHLLECELVLWLSEAERMPQKWWHASSEPKPRGALSTCPPCVFVAAMRTRLGYPCGRRHVEQAWIASAAWPKPASISWQKWVRLAKTGRTTPVTTWTCEQHLLIVVCHCGSESCVLHSIIVAIANWHTHLESRVGCTPGRIIRSNFHLQIKWVPVGCFFTCIDYPKVSIFLWSSILDRFSIWVEASKWAQVKSHSSLIGITWTEVEKQR